MKLSNTAYDILKWVGRIVLPALATLYTAIGKVWGLPFTEQIPATIMAVDLFLNSLLGIAQASYQGDSYEG